MKRKRPLRRLPVPAPALARVSALEIKVARLEARIAELERK
jgi:ubiquinone biosynthesis protein UbiJ